MDSLLATYASSDEEDDQQQSLQQQPVQNQAIQSTFSSKPPSKFGVNFFSSLPPPKSQPANPPPQTLPTTIPSSAKPNEISPQSRSDSPPSTSLFSKLPQPKSEKSDPFSLNPKPKKVVQFRPPVISRVVDDDDEEDDEKKEKTKKDDYVPQAPSVKSFLSSIPAPRNSGSLGALPSSAGVGRRSILEAEVLGLSNSNVGDQTVRKSGDNQVKFDNNSVSTDANLCVESYVKSDNAYNEYVNVAPTSVDYASYDYGGYGEYQNVGTDHSSYGPAAAAPAAVDHASYSSYEGYSGYGNHGQYESKWIDRSTASLEPTIPMAEARPLGKRGRNEIPDVVIEVNQDELMNNRPREDQVKLTGIAFGPSYQPASSTKGKPSKLHKRKHQIGSLYFDMRSKEAELAERRSKGFLTKAETHAKYGW